MSKILITGGCGMIGSNLTRHLIAEGHDVTIVDNLWRGRLEYISDLVETIDYPEKILLRNLTLPGALDDIIGQFDYVYHLADIVAGIGFVFNNQRWLFRQNILINSNVFDSIAIHGRKIKGLVYVGTACSYPKKLQFGVDAPPLTENDMYPADPESAYGWSKLMGQIEAQLLSSELSIPLSVPILHNVYGSPCDIRPGRSQVIPSLCRRVAESVGSKIAVWGSGEQGRAFVHVQDVVDALVLCRDHGLGQGEIQIGPNICTSIGDVARALVKVSGKSLDIIFDKSKPEGDGGRCAEGVKAKEILGWTPRIKIETGLELTYKWVFDRLKKSQ